MNVPRLSRRELLTATAGLAGSLALASNSADATPSHFAAPTLLRSQGQQTLRIALNGTRDTAKQQEALNPPFLAKHSGVKIEYVPIQARDWGEYFSKILTMRAAGQSLDIAAVDTTGIQVFATQGLAAPLDDYVKRDQSELSEFFADVHPALVEAMMYEGSLYEFPTDFNAVNMYLNMDVLRKAGYDYPPATWTKDDFYNMAKKLTQKGKTFGYGWIIRVWGSWTPWMNANNGDWMQFGRAPGGEWLWQTFYKGNAAAQGRGGGLRWGPPTCNSSENVEALQFVVDLTKEGIAPTADVGGGNTLQGFFTSGKLGMTPAGGFWAGGMHSAGMKPTSFDVQFWPKWQTQRTHFGTAGYVLMKSAQDKDLAWEYLKYRTSKDAMTISLKGNTSTPTRRSMMTAERYQETGPTHWQVFYSTLDKDGTRAFPNPPQYLQIEKYFLQQTSLAASGEKTPKDALDEMQKQMEAVFAQSKQ